MARRNFSRPHRLHVLNELNVTPLLDLCFCLLIIFMIATPVLEQTAHVDLPVTNDKGGGPKGPKPKSVVVAFTQSGDYMLGDRRATLEEIRDKFREISGMPKEDQPLVRIRGDRRGGFEPFARIMDEFKRARLTKMGLDYQE